MTDKKALFIAAMAADADTVQDVSENRFAIVTPSEADGQRVTRGEYQVWTDEEALSFGYERGGVDTADPTYKVYRIF